MIPEKSTQGSHGIAVETMNAPEAKAEFITHLLDGNNAMVKGDLDMAIHAYNRALALNPTFALIYSKIGQVYQKKNNLEEAIIYYKRALELAPEQTETLYRLGKVYGEKGMPIQAAVAFDMAREHDQAGEFEDRIDSSLHKIRRRSSGRTLHKIPIAAALRESFGTIAVHPTLFIPAIASALPMLIYNGLFSVLWIHFTHKPPNVLLTGYILGSRPPDPISSGFYYFILAFLLAFVSVPLFGAVMVITQQIEKQRDAFFFEALAHSFKNISQISGATLALLAGIASTAIVFFYVFESFGLMIQELLQVDIILYLRALIFPICILFLSYFIYILPGLAIDQRTMDKAFKKAMLFPQKFFWATFFILLAYSAVQLLASRLISHAGAIPFVFSQAILVPAQTYLAVLITIIYTKSQQTQRKHREKKEEIKITAKYREPAEPLEETFE
jgi:hypothetical protein